MNTQYCRYFQAYVKPETCWFVVAVLKAEENVVFTRTFDTKNSILEFFVPIHTYDQFIVIVDRLIDLDYVGLIIEKENRYFKN